MHKQATPLHYLLALLAILPFLLHFPVVSYLFAGYWMAKQYWAAVLPAAILPAGYGLFAGILSPILLVKKREISRGALLVLSIALLVLGMVFGVQLIQAFAHTAVVISRHPSGSTRYFGILTSAFMLSFLTVYPVVFGICGLRLLRKVSSADVTGSE